MDNVKKIHGISSYEKGLFYGYLLVKQQGEYEESIKHAGRMFVQKRLF